MDQEKEDLAKKIEILQDEIAKYRKNEERWSGRVTKLMGKIIDLEQQVKELEQTAGEQQAQKKTATEGARRLMHLTEALSEPLVPLLERSRGILEDDLFSAAPRAPLEEIHQLAKKLQSIIFYRQELIRLEDGTGQAEPDWFDLGRFLIGLTDEFAVRAESKGLFFAFSCDEGFPGPCLADSTRIRLVIDTLLDRALEQTDKGQIGLRATCKLSGEENGEFSLLLMYSGMNEDTELLVAFSDTEESAGPDDSTDEDQMKIILLRKQARLMGGTLAIDNPTGSGRKPLLRFTLPVGLKASTQDETEETEPQER